MVATFLSSPDIFHHIAQPYVRLGLSKLLRIYCQSVEVAFGQPVNVNVEYVDKE